MRILSLFFSDEKGGFTKRLYSLYDALSAEGDNIHFVGSQPIPVVNTRVVQHIAKKSAGGGKGMFFWACFMTNVFFRSFIIARKNKIERIVTFSPFYTALCMFMVLLLKVPAITFIRGDNMLHSSSRLRNAFFFIMDWIGIAISARTVFVSASLEKIYLQRYRIDKHKLAIIPNNIESEYIIHPDERTEKRLSMGISNNNFLISTAGPFNDGKNFSFLIQAMTMLAAHGVKLMLIGDEVKPNGERARLADLATRLGVASSVIFAGWQEDPKPLIACSDLFAFPSKHEGSPNALLEALGCGVPCLGSHIKEIEEVLHYRELLFPLDDVDVFVRKVISLHDDQAYYKKVKILSYARCREFSFNWGRRVVDIVHGKQ